MRIYIIKNLLQNKREYKLKNYIIIYEGIEVFFVIQKFYFIDIDKNKSLFIIIINFNDLSNFIKPKNEI